MCYDDDDDDDDDVPLIRHALQTAMNERINDDNDDVTTTSRRKQFSSVQFVTLLKQNVLRGCRLA